MRGPSKEEMGTFIARHWLDTQQNAVAIASWFEALNAKGGDFPTCPKNLEDVAGMSIFVLSGLS